MRSAIPASSRRLAIGFGRNMWLACLLALASCSPVDTPNLHPDRGPTPTTESAPNVPSVTLVPVAWPADKVVAILSSCDGRSLVPSTTPSLAPVSDDLTQRWLVERIGQDTIRLKAYGGQGYLARQQRNAPLSLTTASNQAAVWRVEKIDQRHTRLTLATGGALAAPTAADTPLLAPRDETCTTALVLDQFPMLSPVSRVVWVDGNAPLGHGDGSSQNPHRTIQDALTGVQPGDHLRVRPGVYRENVVLTPEHSGRPEAWVVLESDVPLAARIEPPQERPAIQILASYIEIHGFSTTNTTTEPCIATEAPGSYIRIIENTAHDCGGGGITLVRGEGYHVEGNVVARNAFTNRYQMSGISLFQPRGPAQCEPWCNVICRNIAYANDNHAQPLVGNVRSDGNGIIVDDSYNEQNGSTAGPYQGSTLIEDNLAFANGGSGLRAYLSDRVLMRRNTSYRNMQRPDRTTWRGDIMSVWNRGTEVHDNIAIVDQANDHNVALFESHRRARGAPGEPGNWSGNLVATHNDSPALGRALVGGALLSEARLRETTATQGLVPVFERPGMDASASFRLIGVRDQTNTLRPPPQVGARDELLPPMR
ncbi:MAG: hypothetical protein ACOYKM_10525 [Caulobacterales bacterium]